MYVPWSWRWCILWDHSQVVRELEDENWYDESFNERRGSQRPSLLRGRIADLMGIAGRPEPIGEAQWVTLTQVRLRLQRRVHSAVWNPIWIPRFEVTDCWNPWLFLSGCFCFVDGVKNEDCKRGQFFWVLGREETVASTAGLERSWKSSHILQKSAALKLFASQRQIRVEFEMLSEFYCRLSSVGRIISPNY